MPRLAVRHVGTVPVRQAIETRVFDIENENGARVTTPIYSIDAYKAVSSSAPLSIGSIEGANTLLEANITSTRLSVLTRLVDAYKSLALNGPPFYIVISPRLSQVDPSTARRLLEKLHEATSTIRELHMFTMVDPAILKDEGLRTYCEELACVPLIAATSVRESTEKLEKAYRLQAENIIQGEMLGAALMQSSMFSISSLSKVKSIVKEAHRGKVPLLIYGSRRGRGAKGIDALRMAENILQYFLAADIVGPPRRAGGGGAGSQQQPLLLVPQQGLYYSVSSLHSLEGEYRALLAEAVTYLNHVSIDELPALSPARIEELSTLNAIGYTYELRSTDPSSMLERIKLLWKNNGLNEFIERLERTAERLHRALRGEDSSLDSYLAGNR